MSRLVAVLIFIIGAALIFVSLRWPEISKSTTAEQAPTPVHRSSKTEESPIPPITPLPIASDASTALRSSESTVEDDLSTIELILSEYARHHEGNPVGENMEITAALLGKNSSRVAYLDNQGPYLDTSSQLIDRWGTPYFFHQLSARHTEIRSAGPDRDFHTADDLVR